MSQYGIWSNVLENWMSFDDMGKMFVASLPIARAQLRCVAEDMEERLQLRVRPFDTEPVTLYGVWASQRKKWYILETGEVFNTPYPSVAAVQIQHVAFRCIEDDYVVREFPPLEDSAIFRS